MSERERRIGANEGIFRQVNEQVERLNESFSLVSSSMTIVCECGEETCIEQIELSQDEYAAVRADPITFVVKPEHAFPDVEDVVERDDRYWIVRKKPGDPARVARETA